MQNYSTLSHPFRQFAGEDRLMISYYLLHNARAIKCGCPEEAMSLREISRQMGCAHTTVSREIARNRNAHGNYVAADAQRMAHHRRYTKPQGIRLKNEGIRWYVESGLHMGWTPEQIAGRLSHDLLGHSLSHMAIYRYLERPENRHLLSYLPRKRLKRKKYAKRGSETKKKRKNDGKPRVDERSVAANTRKEVGHWEVDLIEGKGHKSCILVAHERVTRYTVPILPSARTADSISDHLVQFFSSLPPHMRKSVTCDNGSENARLSRLSEHSSLAMKVYYCYPYRSWEKGGIENANGLIRRIYPKKTDFSCVHTEDMLSSQQRLNATPRKCLGFATCRERFTQELERSPPV